MDGARPSKELAVGRSGCWLRGGRAAAFAFTIVLSLTVVGGRFAAALTLTVILAFAIVDTLAAGLIAVVGNLHDLRAGVRFRRSVNARSSCTGVEPSQSGAGEE